jgi:hypothetical protein
MPVGDMHGPVKNVGIINNKSFRYMRSAQLKPRIVRGSRGGIKMMVV